MEILVNSRLKATRYDNCTNANCILTESWGCGEIKNLVLQSVQASYKILRATKPILPIYRGIAPPMEILVNSWLNPTRCNDCTNATCILTESWECGEIRNLVLQSVQTSYKILRATKPTLPIHRSIAPPMEILVNSWLKPTRCNDCTNATCILTESWGCGKVKNVVLQWMETAHKLLQATKPFLPIYHGIPPSMEILVNSWLKPTRCNDCTKANWILTESWGCGEIKNVLLQSVQATTKFYGPPNPSFPSTAV